MSTYFEQLLHFQRGIMSGLKEYGYAEIPFAGQHALVERAAQDFLAFLTLPQNVKDTFHYMLDGRERGSNAGYARKSRADGDSDDKEYFNYRAVSPHALRIPRMTFGDHPEIERFFASAQRAYHAAVRTLEHVIVVLDMGYPGTYRKILRIDPDRYLALRFVKYGPGGKGGILATGHYDRSTCAMAIAESAPGLRIGTGPGSLKPVERRDPHSALFMPAYTFAKDVGTDEFAPAWHDVVQLTDSTEPRWAMVLFADTPKEGILSYEAVHTPIQTEEGT